MKDLTWLKNNYRELTTKEFYRFIFPIGSFENRGNQSENKPNGVLIHGYKNAPLKKELIFDDLEGIERNAKSGEDCFMPLIGYIGCSNKKKNARKMYALGFDIDYLDLHGKNDTSNYFCPVDKFITWLFEAETAYKTAMPNLISLSSEGHIHFYYVFENPINCYPEILEQLKKFKDYMTDNFWRSEFTNLKKHPIEFESVVQPFRIVGSTNNKHKNKIHGFLMMDKKYIDINHLITTINKTNRIKKMFPYPLIKEKKRDGTTSFKKRNEYHWTCKRDLYDWYLEHLKQTVKQGSRYWRCFVLSSIAFKCKVPKKELEEDLKVLTKILNDGDPDATEPFTWEDAVASLKGYAKEYVNVSIDFVNQKCQTPRIERSRRNFRKQKDHIEYMNFSKMLKRRDPKYEYDKGGRNPKKDIVIAWREQHPNGSKSECKKDLNLCWDTIRKWWNATNEIN